MSGPAPEQAGRGRLHGLALAVLSVLWILAMFCYFWIGESL